MNESAVRTLIDKYEKSISDIINPDGITEWSEIGWDTPPDNFDSIEDYLFSEEELDEGEQTAIRCYEEILEDLRTLTGESTDEGFELLNNKL